MSGAGLAAKAGGFANAGDDMGLTATGTAGRGVVWRQVVLLPLFCLSVLSSAKSFRNNPVIGSPRLNRWGLHVLRRRVAARIGLRRRNCLGALVSAEDVADFERDGFLVKPNFLDAASFRALHDEIMGLAAPAREAVIGDVLTRLIPLDGRALGKLPTARAVLEGARYRGLLDFVSSYRRRPHLYVQTVFSQYCDGPPDIQSFYHSDTFHPTLKSWFYLEDVEDDAAPLAYVPGSHRITPRRLAIERRISRSARAVDDRLTGEGSFRFSEAQIRQLGYGPPRRLPVAANTLVIADTSGIHRRSPAGRCSARVSIWAYSRRNPFLPWVGSDLTGFSAIRNEVRRLYWAVTDRMKDGQRARGDWQWVGTRSPLTPPSES